MFGGETAAEGRASEPRSPWLLERDEPTRVLPQPPAPPWVPSPLLSSPGVKRDQGKFPAAP